MASADYLTSGKHTSVELTAPRGADREEFISSIEGFAQSHGLSIVRSDAPAVGEHVELDELLDLSDVLFKTVEYGKTALSILETERRRVAANKLTRRTLVNASRTRNTVNINAAGLDPYRTSRYQPLVQVEEPTPIKERKAIETALAKLWPNTPFPTEAPRIEPTPDSYDGWSIIAGMVTSDRLAHFLRNRNLVRHHLSGALGKALDILNVRAGTLDFEDAQHDWLYVPNRSFVSYRALKDAVAASDLSRHNKDAIHSEINKPLVHALFHYGQHLSGTPLAVVEGNVRVGEHQPNDDPYVTFSHIAVSSVAHVFDDVPQAQHKAGREFIRDFVASQK